MAKKKTNYTKSKVKELPNDKPVLYKIKTDTGKTNYIGIAKKGRVSDRVTEHIGEIPGATVEIEQFSSIKDAREKESNAIKRTKPKYNDQGK